MSVSMFINTKQNFLVSSICPQLQQFCSSSFKLHLEAELLLDGCFHAHLHWLFYQVNTGIFYLSIQNILRDRICDGMELSCSYENKYLRPQDNGEKIPGDDIDDDDDIFKQKDIIMKVMFLLLYFALNQSLLIRIPTTWMKRCLPA